MKPAHCRDFDFVGQRRSDARADLMHEIVCSLPIVRFGLFLEVQDDAQCWLVETSVVELPSEEFHVVVAVSQRLVEPRLLLLVQLNHHIGRCLLYRWLISL